MDAKQLCEMAFNYFESSIKKLTLALKSILIILVIFI